MRSVALGMVLAGLAACADNPAAPLPIAPNTDVGLRVWAAVSPTTVSARDTAALLRLRVYASNPSRHAVHVVSGGPPYVFTTNPAATKGLWGSLRIANAESPLNAGPNVDWWGQPVYAFAPRETQYNEYWVSLQDWRARGWALTPGEYRIRGWFNGREGGSATLTITP